MNKTELIEKYSKGIQIGSHGFIRLVDTMGDDSSIVQAARVSYGKGTKSTSEDEKLIRYLMRHRHTTPFEMCEIKLHIKLPMDTNRQFIRHRTASVNEYSTRYSSPLDDKAITLPGEWRLQSVSNKQGSAGILEEFPSEEEFIENLVAAGASTEEIELQRFNYDNYVNNTTECPIGEYLSAAEDGIHNMLTSEYYFRVGCGIAREQARKDLPLSNYTVLYWKIDLHNLLHFLSLRMHPHAQKEIRDIAEAIASIVQDWVPMAYQAFLDYRLNAVTFSAQEMTALLAILNREGPIEEVMIAVDKADIFASILTPAEWSETNRKEFLARHIPTQRERIEFWQKINKD